MRFRHGSGITFALLLTACGGGGGDSNSGPGGVTPPPPPVTLNITASTTQLLAGGAALPLSASVSNGAAVSWQLAPGAPGSLSAASGNATSYLPPAAADLTANTTIRISASAGGASREYVLTVFPDPGPAGVAHIAGGTGRRAFVDGLGDVARYGWIADMARGQGGDLTVADTLPFGEVKYSALRRVYAGGNTSLLARTEQGHADGSGAQMRLGRLLSVSHAANGTIWFLDEFGGTTYLRQMAVDGSVSTLSSAPALAAARRVVAAGDATAYLIGEKTVLKADGNGALAILAGSDSAGGQPGLDGNGTAARFQYLNDLAITAAGNLLVADHCAIRQVTPAGAVSTLAGALQDCSFGQVASVAADGSGNVYGLVGLEVRKLEGGTVRTVATAARPATPNGILMAQSYPKLLRQAASGNLVLAREGQIEKLQDNQLLRLSGLEDDSVAEIDGAASVARFVRPSYLAADLAGNLYVADDLTSYGGHIVGMLGLNLRKVAPNGTVSTLVSADGSFGQPAGMAVDSKGVLHIVERAPQSHLARPWGGAVYRIGANGARTLLAGRSAMVSGNTDAMVDGKGDAARFATPALAGFDADDNLYIRDRNAFRKVAPDGTVSTVAALSAKLGAAADGFVYQSDGASVFKLNADGSRTTVAAPGELPGTGSGLLPGSASTPATLLPTGPYSFAFINTGAIYRLVLKR